MVYLMQLSITPNLKGYHYIKAASLEISKDENKKIKMRSRLFIELSNFFNEKPLLFERAVRHAVEVSYKLKGIERFEKSLHIRFSQEKPSVGELICVLAEKANLEYYQYCCRNKI